MKAVVIDQKTGKVNIEGVKKHKAPVYVTENRPGKYYIMIRDVNGELHDIDGNLLKETALDH